MMGTRTGILSPAIIPYLMEHTEDFKSPEDISRILNRESGLLGVSELSSDMRDIHEAMRNGNDKHFWPTTFLSIVLRNTSVNTLLS